MLCVCLWIHWSERPEARERVRSLAATQQSKVSSKARSPGTVSTARTSESPVDGPYRAETHSATVETNTNESETSVLSQENPTRAAATERVHSAANTQQLKRWCPPSAHSTKSRSRVNKAYAVNGCVRLAHAECESSTTVVSACRWPIVLRALFSPRKSQTFWTFAHFIWLNILHSCHKHWPNGTELNVNMQFQVNSLCLAAPVFQAQFDFLEFVLGLFFCRFAQV